MYRHLLDPIDDTPLAIAVVGKAVEFARTLGARITFFHAGADYGATATGALLRAIEPQLSSRNPRAQRAGFWPRLKSLRVPRVFPSPRWQGPAIGRTRRSSKRPGNKVATRFFMASHGHHGIDPLVLRSQLRRLLSHTTVAVLVARVESNAPASAKGSRDRYHSR